MTYEEWARSVIRADIAKDDKETLIRALRYVVDHDCDVADIAGRAGVKFTDNGRAI